jgi:hypothetical protein
VGAEKPPLHQCFAEIPKSKVTSIPLFLNNSTNPHFPWSYFDGFIILTCRNSRALILPLRWVYHCHLGPDSYQAAPSISLNLKSLFFSLLCGIRFLNLHCIKGLFISGPDFSPDDVSGQHTGFELDKCRLNNRQADTEFAGK